MDNTDIAEILVCGGDQIILLPIHYLIIVKKNGVFNAIKTKLLEDSRLKLVSTLTDFKMYFENSIPSSGENIEEYEKAVSVCASYLYATPLQFRLFLDSRLDSNGLILSLLKKHELLVEFSSKILENHLDDETYIQELLNLGISEDSYLFWVASHSRNISEYLFVGLHASALNSETLVK